MRVPTEYILALISIGAVSTIAFSVLSTPAPSNDNFVLMHKNTAGGFYTALSEDSFSTKSLSRLLSSLEWSVTTPSETVEDDLKKNTELAAAVSYSVPEETLKEDVVVVDDAVVVPVTVEPPPTPSPQMTLQFESFKYYNSSLVEKDPISFGVTVKNVGDTFSATSTFIFTFDKNNDGTIDTVLQERTLLPLIPDELKAESWRNALLPTPGTHKATLCLVPIEDSNVAENCTSFEFTVVPQKSDLVVQPLTITPTNPIAGDTISVSSTLKNQGKGRGDTSITRLRIDAQNNGTWDVILNTETAVLQSGEVLVKEWASAWKSVRGHVKIEVCVDHEDVLTEADERNNCRIDVFTVTPGSYTGASSVTFEIEEGVLSPTSLSVIPGGLVVFSNRDSESYSISGDMGSVFLSPETEGSMQAPLYEGTYKFFTLYGIFFEGTVIVE